MSARKSSKSQKQVSGNAEKYESYKEAWARISLAIENGFFLEAVTIEESIISDRLISYLSRPTTSIPLSEGRHGLYTLTKKWKSELPSGLPFGEYTDLISEVDTWRCLRNEIVHAIVKSEPGQSHQPIEQFLQKAQESAEVGTKLARAVCKWTQEQNKEIAASIKR
ncbi:MAG: hypothetical protein WA902_19600 [Thermosynechococcaceae cyanobacterium]